MRSQIRLDLIMKHPARSPEAAFALAFTYSNQLKAQAVVRQLVAQFVEINRSIQTTEGSPGGNMEILDAASDPHRPFFPNRAKFGAMGLAGGLLLGLLTAFAMRVTQSREMRS
jgi:uncharacterized protein involved in exopolysaccharide biosynthesis